MRWKVGGSDVFCFVVLISHYLGGTGTTIGDISYLHLARSHHSRSIAAGRVPPSVRGHGSVARARCPQVARCACDCAIDRPACARAGPSTWTRPAQSSNRWRRRRLGGDDTGECPSATTQRVTLLTSATGPLLTSATPPGSRCDERERRGREVRRGARTGRNELEEWIWQRRPRLMTFLRCSVRVNWKGGCARESYYF